MATVTLGNIKFNWKGAYNSSTAYVVDDVVSLSGSSYVCIQAGTNQNPSTATAYWEQMSSAGTNGTDLTTTLTTQGDLVYRDGSGLQRLGAGTSGQVLQTGGSGANPSWVNASGGKTLGVTEFTNGTRTVLSASDVGNFFSTNYTQIKANSKLRFDISLIGFQPNQGAIGFELVYDGTTYTGFGSYTYHANVYPVVGHYAGIINGASSTGSKAWAYRWNHHNNASGVPFTVWNPTNTDDARINNNVSRIIITELDF